MHLFNFKLKSISFLLILFFLHCVWFLLSESDVKDVKETKSPDVPVTVSLVSLCCIQFLLLYKITLVMIVVFWAFSAGNFWILTRPVPCVDKKGASNHILTKYLSKQEDLVIALNVLHCCFPRSVRPVSWRPCHHAGILNFLVLGEMWTKCLTVTCPF